MDELLKKIKELEEKVVLLETELVETKDTGMIKIVKKKEWHERLEYLSSQVQYWINPDNKTDKTVEIIHLYYDECIA